MVKRICGTGAFYFEL